MNKEDIARIAHEVNRAYCKALGDESQVAWEEFGEKETTIQGVAFALDEPDATPEKAHESWMAGKAALGWAYGEEKDEEQKTHPCMVPYGELPVEQRAKDYIFLAIVKLLSPVNDAPSTDQTAGAMPITYIGRRVSYSDSLYETGTWLQGQTKMVSSGTASKMLQHPDLYQLGEPVAEYVAAKTDDDSDESERLQAARDSVLAMTRKAAVVDFVTANWPGAEKNLDPKAKLSELQASAIRLIDQYRLP